ncbi:MAG TPA: lysophospholipid acyltransferase family protein [Chthoniobacteraceae bacterium]|jgi:lysophospholipid acyltransferase (LPLAT)-like uncharacterized protein|nr:lysophospholipid acyltransferase family protein [Chthoniobacteraceae bacterium]
MTPRKAALIALVGSVLLRLLYTTLRIRVEDRASALPPRDYPGLWLFWHNRLLMLPYLRERIAKGRKAGALTSASKDGEILAAFLKRFNMQPVRGSSSRRGVAALIEMIRLMGEGIDMGITPDGPRGPRYSFNPGAITLAQKSQAKIFPVHVHYSKCWQLKSWDGFMIPKPFSQVDIVVLPVETVPITEGEAAFESERERLAKILRDGQDD